MKAGTWKCVINVHDTAVTEHKLHASKHSKGANTLQFGEKKLMSRLYWQQLKDRQRHTTFNFSGWLLNVILHPLATLIGTPVHLQLFNQPIMWHVMRRGEQPDRFKFKLSGSLHQLKQPFFTAVAFCSWSRWAGTTEEAIRSYQSKMGIWGQSGHKLTKTRHYPL